MTEDGVLIGISVRDLWNFDSGISLHVFYPFPPHFRRPGFDLIDMINFSCGTFRMVGCGDQVPSKVAHTTIRCLTGHDGSIDRGILANEYRSAALGLLRPENILRDTLVPIENKSIYERKCDEY
jgi:hypothetical protein